MLGLCFFNNKTQGGLAQETMMAMTLENFTIPMREPVEKDKCKSPYRCSRGAFLICDDAAT